VSRPIYIFFLSDTVQAKWGRLPINRNSGFPDAVNHDGICWTDDQTCGLEAYRPAFPSRSHWPERSYSRYLNHRCGFWHANVTISPLPSLHIQGRGSLKVLHTFPQDFLGSPAFELPSTRCPMLQQYHPDLFSVQPRAEAVLRNTSFHSFDEAQSARDRMSVQAWRSGRRQCSEFSVDDINTTFQQARATLRWRYQLSTLTWFVAGRSWADDTDKCDRAFRSWLPINRTFISSAHMAFS
jgi:hypothetical protein